MTIGDWPRYPYRGFMLDTARRFYPVDNILRLLDAMQVAKFNVFHWHLVEDESFPIELKTFPAMWKNGAFESDETYSHDDMKAIVERATRYGIRVIPEFDNPGHSRAVGFDPYFTEVVRCFNDTDRYNLKNAYEIKGTPLSAPLDPSMEKTYEAI
jgi:hexosaminidase